MDKPTKRKPLPQVVGRGGEANDEPMPEREELIEIVEDWQYGAKIHSSLAERILAAGYHKTPQYTEPKPEATYTLICDKCGEIFYSPNGFLSPQLCPECQKSDKILGEEERV